MDQKLIFLNSHRAKSGVVDGRPLPEEYVLLARFFGCGPIDRTGTLDMGLPYGAPEEIPAEGTSADFGAICAEVADGIVDEAVTGDLEVQVAWSGGIDSTVALVSLAARLRERGELERLVVLLSLEAMVEYPWLHENVIMGKLRTRPCPLPLPEALREDAITVTGEHGDQLFGSDHLASLVKGGVAHLPHAQVIPHYAASKLGCAREAERVVDYLAPQVARAPAPIETAFDYLWWCNFSLKWNQVSLRIPAFRRGDVSALRRTTRHYFADPRFQAWSLANPQVRRVRDWRDYKREAKQVILDATGDRDYFERKEKAPSLKGVIVDRKRQGRDRYRVHMYEDLQVRFEVFTKGEGGPPRGGCSPGESRS